MHFIAHRNDTIIARTPCYTPVLHSCNLQIIIAVEFCLVIQIRGNSKAREVITWKLVCFDTQLRPARLGLHVEFMSK